MGKRGGKKKGSDSNNGQHTQMSIRDEVSGKKKANNLKSIRKLQQLQSLAVWAASEASIPSLAALFGRRFAATGEALGLPPDPSLFPCQRCEIILQPGFNCTVRIVKICTKAQREKKKPVSDQQNNVVYKCQFCPYENVKRGTPKGHMIEICPPKPKQPSKPKSTKSAQNKQANVFEQDTIDKLEAEKAGEIASPSMPSGIKGLTLLLDSKKRKRNKPKPKKLDESEANLAILDAKKAEAASTKKRRKGWTTLREIGGSNEKERAKTFTNISISLCSR